MYLYIYMADLNSTHFISQKHCKHIMSTFSIEFLSRLFVVCLFEPVPTSIVLQPRDLSMSFCLIHTESVCLLSNPFIYSHFPLSPSFLLHPSFSLFFSCHTAYDCADISIKWCKNNCTAPILLTHHAPAKIHINILAQRDWAYVITCKKTITLQTHLQFSASNMIVWERKLLSSHGADSVPALYWNKELCV